MSHKIAKYTINNSVGWDWPVNIGFTFPNAQADISAASSSYWGGMYGKYFDMINHFERLNIIFTRMTFDELLEENKLRSEDLKLEADALVFLRNSETDPDFNPDKDKVDELIESYKCGGVSIVLLANENYFAEFMKQFIEGLSHNNNFVRALEIASSKGIHICSEELLDVSEIRNLFRAIKSNLAGDLFKDTLLTITNVRFLNEINFNTEDLISKLRDEEHNLEFDQEKQSALDVLNLNRSIKETHPEFKPQFEGQASKGLRDDLEETGPENGGEATVQYLQGKIIDDSFDLQSFLRQKSSYKLIIRIGDEAAGWSKDAAHGINTGVVFEDEGKDEAEVQIVYFSTHLDEPESKSIKLIKGKSSSTAMFDIDTTPFSDEYLGEVAAYHKGRLIQKALITAAILAEGEDGAGKTINLRVIMSPRKYLVGMGERQSFGTSLNIEEKNGKTGLTAVSNEKVGIVYEASLREKLESLRRIVQKVILKKGAEEVDLYDEELRVSLINIAHKGREIYDSFLLDKIDTDNPIQIISGLKDYFPLDFIYTYPAPKIDAKVCPNSKAALIAGNKSKCSDCIDINSDQPADLICPFGFLGLRNIIERFYSGTHSEKLDGSKDLALVFEPLPGRKTIEILKRTLHASSSRVDKVDPTITVKVKEKLKSSTAEFEEAKDWEKWKDLVQGGAPDTLVLIVHTEENEDFEQDQMEIGDEKFLVKTFLSKDHIAKMGSQLPPLVILIGCNTTETKAAAFDFTSQFINKGAGIVLSNFTKITGRKAGAILVSMMDLIKEMKGEEVTLGAIILKLRQRLMAEGVLASMSLIAHGDADWIIKI